MRRSILIFLALAAPQAGEAQWSVAPQAGYIFFDESSALEGMPMAGVETTWALNEMLTIGLGFDYARGEVDGSLFPPAQLTFGLDSTVYAVINQPISATNYGIRAEAGFGVGALRPYLTAGGGGYTLFLNSQQHNAPATRSGWLAALGGGVTLGHGGSTSVFVDVRDVIYFGFDPNDLNPVREDVRNTAFPELNPEPLEEATMHNIRLSIGFQFQPGGGS